MASIWLAASLYFPLLSMMAVSTAVRSMVEVAESELVGSVGWPVALALNNLIKPKVTLQLEPEP